MGDEKKREKKLWDKNILIKTPAEKRVLLIVWKELFFSSLNIEISECLKEPQKSSSSLSVFLPGYGWK